MLTYTVSETTTRDFDFGLVWTPTVKSLMEKSFPNGTVTEYNAPVENRMLTYGLFPIMGNAAVSRVTAEDLKSLTIAENQSVGLLASLPDSSTVLKNNTSTDYDLTKYKNVNLNGAIKVTATIKDESAKLVTTGATAGSNVYTFTSGGKTVAAGSEMALERFEGLSMRTLCANFPYIESGEQDSISLSMTMNAEQIDTAGTADWYFDAATQEPIACVYKVDVNMDQKIDLSLTKLIDGNFMIDSNMTYYFLYLFSNYYPTQS